MTRHGLAIDIGWVDAQRRTWWPFPRLCLLMPAAASAQTFTFTGGATTRTVATGT